MTILVCLSSGGRLDLLPPGGQFVMKQAKVSGTNTDKVTIPMLLTLIPLLMVKV
jgi:hypothetical protein